MNSSIHPRAAREVAKPTIRTVHEVRADVACRNCSHNEDVHTDWRTDDSVCRCGCREYDPYNRVLEETDEVWLEDRLDHWIVAQRLVLQGGHPVIGEIRVFPAAASERPKAGRWLHEGATVPPIPRGGISSRLLHRINLGIRLKFGPGALEILRRHLPDTSAVLTPPAVRRPSLAQRGRKRTPDEFYAKVADLYARAVKQDPRRFLKLMAGWLDATAPRVHGWVSEARRRKLLTSPGKRGMVGGEPTPRARALLRTRRRQPGRRRGKAGKR